MRAIITFLSLVALSLTIHACATVSKCQDPAQRNTVECAVINSVVDCLTPEAKQLESEFGPLVKALIAKYTSSNGTIDWTTLANDAGLNATTGVADGMCVIADVVKDLQTKVTAEGSATRPNYAALSVGFDVLRAKVAPGVKFRTRNGDL